MEKTKQEGESIFVYHYSVEDDGSLECDCHPDDKDCPHGLVHLYMDPEGRSHIWSAVGIGHDEVLHPKWEEYWQKQNAFLHQ